MNYYIMKYYFSIFNIEELNKGSSGSYQETQ